MDKDKYMMSLVWYLIRNDTDGLIYKTETNRLRENELMVARGKEGEKDRELEMDVYTHCCTQNG